MNCKKDNILTGVKNNISFYKDHVFMPVKNTCSSIRPGIISLCFLIASAITLHAQQPVQVNTILRPPYTLQLSDYYASTQEKLIVALTNRDLNKPVLHVRLRMTIESQSVQLRTREFAAIPVLPLEAGVPLRLSLGDLAPYFNTENLEFSGTTRAQYAQQAKLPEGFYQFCFEAIEVSTGQVASGKGCAMAWISLSDPPFLNLPQKGESISLKEPQNIIFQWTPRHLNSPNTAYATEYDFQLAELWDNSLSPEVAFQLVQPLYETTTRTTTLLYGPSQPLLIAGRRYGWRVRARAKNGAMEADIFRNQGFSEIYWFTHQEFCPPPSGVSAAPGQYGNFDISWMPNGRHTAYMITYRQKDKADAAWFDQQSSSTLALLYDVQPGFTYEYRVGAFCNTDQPVFSDLHTIQVPARETVSFANCRIVPDPQISNKQVLNVLKPGDVITAGNFPVKLSHVAGSGSFAGKGYVTVPFLGKAKVRVRFDNIQVNMQHQLIAGTVITTYDENEGSIVDIDEGADIFRGYEGIVSRLQGFSADTDIDELKKLLDKLVENAEQELPDAEAEKVKNTAAELLEAKEAYDQIKNVYDALPDEDPLKKELKKDLDEASKKFEEIKSRFDGKDENAITTEKHTVRFDLGLAPDPTAYGFDAFKSPRPESNYDIIQQGSDKYFVAWKSVALGGYDWVNAYPTTPGEDLPDNMVFRSSTGALVSKSILYGKGFAVKVHGYGVGEKNELIAYQKKEIDGKEVNIELGKLNVVSYEKLYKKVVLVPVNNTPLPLSQNLIREKLNEIYSQAVVEWSVDVKASLSSDYDVTNDGLDDDEEMLKKSSYTPEMKTIIDDYKKREAFDADAQYLFIVPRSKSAFQGYNPYKKQVGFVYLVDPRTDGGTFVATVAHELGHGAFNLKHTFDNTSLPRGSTDNLMDYSGGASRLYKYQWDLIHDPAFRIPLFESDEDAAYKVWTNLTHDVIANIRGYDKSAKGFLSPAGKIITLPENARDFEFYNGYLFSFTIGNERYSAMTGEQSGSFMGYFFNALDNKPAGPNVTAYQGPAINVARPFIFYVLKDATGCGKYNIYKANYKPAIGTIIDGGVGNIPSDLTRDIRELNDKLESHQYVDNTYEGINCLSEKAKELYKFIEEHYASHNIIIPDKDKNDLKALLGLFNNVLIKGLDVDPDKKYEPAHESIRIREMLDYGYIEFIEKLKGAALSAAGKKKDLVVEFEDFHRMKDAYLIYKIMEKSDPDCVWGEDLYDQVKEQLRTTGEVEFNMEFFTALTKTGYELKSGNEIFEALVCLLKSVRIPDKFYNPHNVDNKLQGLYKDLLERVLNVKTDNLIADIPLEAANFALACGCGLWNSAVDVVKGFPELGAGVTQNPRELIRKTGEFITTVKENWSGIPAGIWSMLKEHHGYVEGYGVDSYQATYGACYDVVFVASIFIGLKDLGLLYEAGKAGDIGEMGLIILRAGKNYPRELLGTLKRVILATARLSNVAVRKAIIGMIEHIPDQIGISSIDGVHSVMIVNPETGEIARFTNEGVEITARAGSTLSGNVKYQSPEIIVDISNGRTSGRLLLLADKSGKVIAATVGDIASTKWTHKPVENYNPGNTGPIATFFDEAGDPAGTLSKVTETEVGTENFNKLNYTFEFAKSGIPPLKDLRVSLEKGILKIDFDADQVNTSLRTVILKDVVDYFGREVIEGIRYALARNIVEEAGDKAKAALSTVVGQWAVTLKRTAVEFPDGPDKAPDASKVPVLFMKERIFVENIPNADGSYFGTVYRETEVVDNRLKYTFQSSDGTIKIGNQIMFIDRKGILQGDLKLEQVKGKKIGTTIFNDAVKYFSSPDKLKGFGFTIGDAESYIEGSSDILIAYRKNLSTMDPEDAILATHFGPIAKKAKFTKVTFDGDHSAEAPLVYAVCTPEDAGFIKKLYDEKNNNKTVGKLYRRFENGNERRLDYTLVLPEPINGKQSLPNLLVYLDEDGFLGADLRLTEVRGKGVGSTIFDDGFNLLRRHGINGIRDSWIEDESRLLYPDGLSDNLKIYREVLEKELGTLTHPISQAARQAAERKAAFATITGQWATKYGFDNVEFLSDNSLDSKVVRVRFTKKPEGEGFVKEVFTLGGTGQVRLGKLYRQADRDIVTYTFRFTDPALSDISEQVALNRGIFHADFGFLRAPDVKGEAYADDVARAIQEDAALHFGNQITTISDEWNIEGSDYRLYQEALKTGTPWQAAFATRSGKLAKAREFTRVVFPNQGEEITPVYNKLNIQFRRHGTSVKDIADENGVTLGTLYRQHDDIPAMFTYYFESADGKLKVNNLVVQVNQEGISSAIFKIPTALQQRNIATEILTDAKKQFQALQLPVTSFRGNWSGNGDMAVNYQAFLKAFEQSGDAEDAALATPSGKIISRLFDFKRVVVTRDDARSEVIALFSAELEGFIKKIRNRDNRISGKLYKKESNNPDEASYTFELPEAGVPAINESISLNNGILQVNIILLLKNVSGNDLKKTLLSDAAGYFGKEKIQGISDIWNNTNEDYTLYLAARQQSQTPEQAAFATVSGQLAMELGLSRVVFSNQTNQSVTVLFTKPGILVKAYMGDSNEITGRLYRDQTADNNRQLYYFESPGGVRYDNLSVTLNNEGVLIVAIRLPANEKRNEIYAAILEDAKRRFGSRIVALQDHWSGEFNDGNYEAYLRAFKIYNDPEIAALMTPIGKGIAEHLGLTSARAAETAGVVNAVFTKERPGFVGKIFGKDNGKYVGKLYRESEADINNLVYYCEPSSGARIIDLVVILDKDGTLTRELNLARLEDTDIHTAILKDALVQYAAQGKFIKTFQDRWREGSESNRAFRQALQNVSTDPEVAASATPWGLILAEHLGFKSVDIIQEPGSVTAIFYKETEGFLEKIYDQNNAFIGKLYWQTHGNELVYSLKLPELRQGAPVYLGNQIAYLNEAEDIVEISFELGHIRGRGAATQILDDAEGYLDIRARKGMRHYWKGNSEDLVIYRENIAAGMTPTEAALATPSGKWAAEYEFTSVKFEGDNSPDAKRIIAVFTKKERTRVVVLPGYDPKKSGPMAEFFAGTESLGILSKEIEGVKRDRLYYAFHFSKKDVPPITENVHVFLDNDGIITATLNLERVSDHGIGSVIRTDVEKCFGDRIKGIHATWVEDKDKVVFKTGAATNLNQYRKVLSATGNHALAALSTFTGKWAEALQCTNVTFIGDNSLTSPKIEVLFIKK